MITAGWLAGLVGSCCLLVHAGPWAHIASLSHSGGPAGNYEDPFLYTDERGWHLIYHVYNTHENPPHGHECVNSTVSAHAFSIDGFNWHMSPLSPCVSYDDVLGYYYSQAILKVVHGHSGGPYLLSCPVLSILSCTHRYGTQVKLTTGETVTVATRERPKMWFNSQGQKTHLFNGAN